MDVTAEVPLVLDRYRLIRRLGSGGFGTVWLARDERLDRDVAVKRIPLEGEDNPRAEREALAAARLSHPGIVALYEAGRDDEAWYLVSELVHGQTLAALERDGLLSDLDVVRIGVALCDALAHAHARGVIHRDVKPANVMVPDGNGGGASVAKLTDFGIARLAEADELTRTGDVVGTLAYMAPEQAEGRRITGAADLYALGLVLYEALGGINPVRAESPGATARRVGMELEPLRRLRRDLPPALCSAIDAAVEADPEERCDVADLRAALLAAESQVEDEPGIVSAGALEEWGDRTRVLADRTRRFRERLTPLPAEEGAWGRDAGEDRLGRDPHAAFAEGRARGDHHDHDRAALPARVLAGAGAAALAAWALSELPVELGAGGALPSIDPGAAAAVAGLAVALLPRVAWLLAAALLMTAVGPDRTALVLAAAAAPVVILLPRGGTLWSLPAAAPLLGAIGLAGLFPALAGQPRGPITRAALGALGLWWLTIAGIATEERPDLGVLTEPAVFAFAGLWAVAAAVLPYLVRGRNAAIDIVGATIWAAGLASATASVAEALSASRPEGAVVGAVLGAIVAVGARAFRRGPTA